MEAFARSRFEPRAVLVSAVPCCMRQGARAREGIRTTVTCKLCLSFVSHSRAAGVPVGRKRKKVEVLGFLRYNQAWHDCSLPREMLDYVREACTRKIERNQDLPRTGCHCVQLSLTVIVVNATTATLIFCLCDQLHPKILNDISLTTILAHTHCCCKPFIQW